MPYYYSKFDRIDIMKTYRKNVGEDIVEEERLHERCTDCTPTFPRRVPTLEVEKIGNTVSFLWGCEKNVYTKRKTGSIYTLHVCLIIF